MTELGLPGRWLAAVPPAHRLLLAALTLLVAPHLLRLPLWMAAIILLLLFWRLAHDAGRLKLPGRGLLTLLVFGVIGGLMTSYHTLAGRDAGAALLLFLVTAKLLEMHRRRDVFVVFFLAHFLLVVGFLFDQSLLYSLWSLATLFLLLGAQIHFARFPRTLGYETLGPDLRLAFRMLLQSAPVAIILFLLFPRPDGPLWGMPEEALAARTGLSDTLSPGHIGRLSDDDSVAFRVRFSGPMPPPGRLYWRGLVHTRFDGRNWRTPRRLTPAIDPLGIELESHEQPVTYTLTLQPHDRRWLFFLDAPLSVPADVVVTRDRQILADRPVRELMRYSGVSALRYAYDRRATPAAELLAVPPTSAPRTRQLIRQLRRRHPEDRALIHAVLERFRRLPYYYSRRPPRLSGDPVDGFLFDTRTGFCEHYASAFAVQMRLAGIPARIIAGYQGGEPNPLDDYLIVRQSDAHAWVEVWLAGEGWLRIDPTAAIPPERILDNPERLRPRRGDEALDVLAGQGWLQRGLRQALFAWDMINNRWNQWILGFDRGSQRDLFARFGVDVDDWRQVAMVLALAALLAMVPLLLLFHRRERTRPDPLRRQWELFCRKLSRRGLTGRAGETPRQFVERCAGALPRHADTIRTIGRHYLILRYGRQTEEGGESLRELREHIRRFRP